MSNIANFSLIKNVSLAFAIGDALGAIYEDASPTNDEVVARFRNNNPIQFTDDTFLLLSTLKALVKTQEKLTNAQSKNFWSVFNSCTCQQLYDWYLTRNYRGIGDTTLTALKQMEAYYDLHSNFDGFSINSARAYRYENSAGNGALSRALPLCLLKNIPTGSDFCKWVALTHLHTEAHHATIDLVNFVKSKATPNFTLSDKAKGFYAPETLGIAIRSIKQSQSIEEVFYSSLVADGDNDSICALSFALWYLENRPNAEFTRLANRLEASGDFKFFDKIDWERIVSIGGLYPDGTTSATVLR
ncbi:MAG: ADP-ribosylglycohydrolase family protein [Oligoflexia bacterium]|nr:ADP-ribosylglycohydrolase family protein [Oligoflexia bacterium]MBF0365401.1 ADP-ribosylglycohydrolase family protein [Oligoflexia bacterium]